MGFNKNYYAILGISKDSSIDIIKKAYRQKVKEWHPDRNKHPKAMEMIVDINEAYEVLKDPGMRANYDILFEALFSTQIERYCRTQQNEEKVEYVRSSYQEEVRKHEDAIQNIKFNLRSLDEFLEKKMFLVDNYIEGTFYWVGKVLLWGFGILWIISFIAIQISHFI